MSDHLADLREALQEHVPNDGDDLGVLTGYVVVAQWSDGDSGEWLTRTAGTINDEGASLWAVKGWLQHSLDNLALSTDDE